MANLPYEDICVCIMDDVPDVEDLCTLLEIDVPDLLEAFPDKVMANVHKFLLPNITDGVLDDDEEEYEQENAHYQENQEP